MHNRLLSYPSPSMLPVCATKVGARLVDRAYRAWQVAQLECEIALAAWQLAGVLQAAAAYRVYTVALEHEAAVARDFEELCRVAAALTNR